jgi:ABC-2 family transporter protein
MIALTWRQHRAQLLAAAAMIAALGGYLVFVGHQMTSYMASIGLSACLARHGNCGLLDSAFLSRFNSASDVFSLLDLVPLLAGLFWGAPLIARETERGTHRLAWTQSVSRGRWLTVKLAAFTGAAVLAAAIVSLLLAWWLRPYDQLIAAGFGGKVNRMTPGVFDLAGIAPAACAVFAFALGTAAGALIRRTVPAMAVTLGGYLVVWLQLRSLRYHFFAPLTVHGPFGSAPLVPPSAYVLSTSYSDSSGHPVDFSAMVNACQATHGGETGISVKCLADKGFQFSTTYQPDSRFWPVQGIEAGILAAAAIALIGLAVWWSVRRIS